MAVDPDFLDDHHHAHEHDPAVESIAVVHDARYDRMRLASFLERLLDARGDDLFRVKGIVALAGDHRRCVLQAVHRIMEFRPANPWGTERPTSKIVFIGRNLDRAAIEAGLKDCLAA
jgi:G3E family GTPase